MGQLGKIISGGQSGVDRAALDTALELGIPYGGWCPRGGWAEDLPNPPGLLAHYPLLQETEESEPAARTLHNLRDSHATLVIWPDHHVESPGTQLTNPSAAGLARAKMEVQIGGGAAGQILAWLEPLPDGLWLNIGGPRESEAPGIYAEALALLHTVLGAVR